jgi:hypothetical protein
MTTFNDLQPKESDLIKMTKSTGFPMALSETKLANQKIEVCVVTTEDGKPIVGETIIESGKYSYQDTGQRLFLSVESIVETRPAHKNYPPGSWYNKVICTVNPLMDK